jgi:toxin ParE1/3/4
LHPSTGSPRHGQELHIPGLRAWPLSRFAHLAIYFELDHEVEIWRVLHSAVDRQRWLQ